MPMLHSYTHLGYVMYQNNAILIWQILHSRTYHMWWQYMDRMPHSCIYWMLYPYIHCWYLSNTLEARFMHAPRATFDAWIGWYIHASMQWYVHSYIKCLFHAYITCYIMRTLKEVITDTSGSHARQSPHTKIVYSCIYTRWSIRAYIECYVDA